MPCVALPCTTPRPASPGMGTDLRSAQKQQRQDNAADAIQQQRPTTPGVDSGHGNACGAWERGGAGRRCWLGREAGTHPGLGTQHGSVSLRQAVQCRRAKQPQPGLGGWVGPQGAA